MSVMQPIDWFGIARARGNALQDAAIALEKLVPLVSGGFREDALAAADAARRTLEETYEL